MCLVGEPGDGLQAAIGEVQLVSVRRPPAIVATGGRVVPLIANLMRLLGRKEISPEARRGIRSLENRIDEHQRKLQDFKDNPTVRPGMEKLPQEVVARQHQRRIKHLEREIKAFRGNIEKLKNPPPPPPPPRPGS